MKFTKRTHSVILQKGMLSYGYNFLGGPLFFTSPRLTLSRCKVGYSNQGDVRCWSCLLCQRYCNGGKARKYVITAYKFVFH